MHITLCSLSTMLGGVELRMALEARLLTREGHKASIAINLHPGLNEWAQALRSEGIPIVHYDPEPVFEGWWWYRKYPLLDRYIFKPLNLKYKAWIIGRSLNKIIANRQAFKLFSRTSPDVVHISVPWSGFETTRLYLAHVYNLPIVMIVHNAFPKFEWSPWHRKHYLAAFSSVRGIYAVSQSALDYFVDLYGEFIRPHTVLHVIHNSVDTMRFKPDASKRVAARQRLNIPMEAPVVGFVGRIEKQKRPKAIIEAFARIVHRISCAYLVMVGSGPLEKTVRKMVDEYGLKDRVIFAGWQSNVEDFIPAFDVVLQLSNNEGFGTSTAEAMACGVPVVGTDVPGTRDILLRGRGGVLVPLADEQAAADACSLLLKDSSMRFKLAEEARLEAIEQYQESAWGKKVLDFYGQIFPDFNRATERKHNHPAPAFT